MFKWSNLKDDIIFKNDILLKLILNGNSIFVLINSDLLFLYRSILTNLSNYLLWIYLNSSGIITHKSLFNNSFFYFYKCMLKFLLIFRIFKPNLLSLYLSLTISENNPYYYCIPRPPFFSYNLLLHLFINELAYSM